MKNNEENHHDEGEEEKQCPSERQRGASHPDVVVMINDFSFLTSSVREWNDVRKSVSDFQILMNRHGIYSPRKTGQIHGSDARNLLPCLDRQGLIDGKSQESQAAVGLSV